ncbi:MAG: hypothetical protein ABQ298_08100 [Puniceicoccaceae bacterium]
MSDTLQHIIFQIQLLFSGRPVWLVIVVALVVTMILKVMLSKLFKLALNVIFFVLIYVLVLVGLGYLLNGGFASVPI